MFAVFLLCVFSTCSGGKKESSENSDTPPQKEIQPSSYHLSEPWNRSFHRRETEDGEILAIGAVFSNDSTLFVYDLAAGSVVSLDSTLRIKETVSLAPIGRNTYMGDDFVVRDSVFIFLNSIDRKLEYFSRTTGAHVNSVPIPSGLLSYVNKRSQRVLSRLFMKNGQLFVGNEYHLVSFDPVAGKRRAGQALLSAGTGRRYMLPRDTSWITENDSGMITGLPGRILHMTKTYLPVSGKRLFSLHGKLYTISAAKDSVVIGTLP